MDLERVYYTAASSRFGEFALAWTPLPDLRVVRVFIPQIEIGARARVLGTFPGAVQKTASSIDELVMSIFDYLEGGDIKLKLDLLAMDECNEFQRKVLVAEFNIPRGWLSTYGRIAKRLGSPGSSRAVGRALATNPFPLVIPCHRAVRSDGGLGGYQGGIGMKRKLLEMEGVQFKPSGKVAMDRLYY